MGNRFLAKAYLLCSGTTVVSSSKLCIPSTAIHLGIHWFWAYHQHPAGIIHDSDLSVLISGCNASMFWTNNQIYFLFSILEALNLELNLYKHIHSRKYVHTFSRMYAIFSFQVICNGHFMTEFDEKIYSNYINQIILTTSNYNDHG